MSDAELLSAFERTTIPPGDFRHREHVRVTWLYLGMYGPEETERRLQRGLAALAASAGKPEKFDAALTRAWIAAIETARAASPDVPTFDGFIADHPHLLDARAGLEA